MELVVNNIVNFDTEYKFLENFRVDKLKKQIDEFLEHSDVIRYIGEYNKNDLML